MYAQSDYSFHLNSKHKSSQRKTSAELGCSSYLFKYGKHNNSDQLDCMVEKVSQLDEELLIIIEGIKNPPHLFVERELMVHESSQSNIQVQEEIIDTKENEVASNGSSLTITFTSSRSCKKNVNIGQSKKMTMLLSPKNLKLLLKLIKLYARSR